MRYLCALLQVANTDVCDIAKLSLNEYNSCSHIARHSYSSTTLEGSQYRRTSFHKHINFFGKSTVSFNLRPCVLTCSKEKPSIEPTCVQEMIRARQGSTHWKDSISDPYHVQNTTNRSEWLYFIMLCHVQLSFSISFHAPQTALWCTSGIVEYAGHIQPSALHRSVSVDGPSVLYVKTSLLHCIRVGYSHAKTASLLVPRAPNLYTIASYKNRTICYSLVWLKPVTYMNTVELGLLLRSMTNESFCTTWSFKDRLYPHTIFPIFGTG